MPNVKTVIVSPASTITAKVNQSNQQISVPSVNSINVKINQGNQQVVQSAYQFVGAAASPAAIQNVFNEANTAILEAGIAYQQSSTAYQQSNIAYQFATSAFAQANLVSLYANSINVAVSTANNALPNVGPIIAVNYLSQLYVTNNSTSVSNSTGSMIINGGLGVKGNINMDGLYLTSSNFSANAIVIDGGLF